MHSFHQTDLTIFPLEILRIKKIFVPTKSPTSLDKKYERNILIQRQIIHLIYIYEFNSKLKTKKWKTKKIFFNKQRFYNFRWQCSHLNIFLKTRKHPKNGQMKVGICIFFAISIHTTHTQTTSLIHLTSSLVPNKASFHLSFPHGKETREFEPATSVQQRS